MKIFNFLIFNVLLVFTFNQLTIAQTGNTFTSLAGGFSVDLPGNISGSGSNGTAGGMYLEWRQPEAVYTIGFYEIAGLPLAKIDGAFSFDQMVKMYLNKFSEDGEKLSDKTFILQEKEGREYKYKTASAIYLLRLYKDGDRLYKVLAEIPIRKQSGEENVLRVFDSFRILDSEKVKAAMAKKLADATPKALPQTPPVAKPKSDIRDRNLKAQVKTVLTEIALYGLKDSLRQKQPKTFEEFDEGGNLLKSIEYNSDGNPSNVRVYGYIAGKRVARLGSITYENESPGIFLDESFSAKADKRFDESYTYKYAGDNLIEERKYFSNGALETRSAIKYLKNKREQTFYGEGAKPFQKFIFTMDEKGNDVEMLVTEFGGMFSGEVQKYKVEYDSFDEKGNWTKRTVSKWFGFQNKGNYSPEYIEYRVINYFE